MNKCKESRANKKPLIKVGRAILTLLLAIGGFAERAHAQVTRDILIGKSWCTVSGGILARRTFHEYYVKFEKFEVDGVHRTGWVQNIGWALVTISRTGNY